ncbi:MAG: hypothetical protein JOZ42_15120 [Acetobacteraceae bacterium]|nr:hypothetical protein [Acetobacteraceae bacterium]
MATELIAVIVASSGGAARILTIGGGDRLPSGPLESRHRSLQSGLRAWVEAQTRHQLGYMEQLYTFADPDRTGSAPNVRVISVSYLGLTRESQKASFSDAGWRDWYRYFPWEDHRAGAPPLIAAAIAPRLSAWAHGATTAALRRERRQRADITFGLNGHRWNEELALHRYELMFEAGLVEEAHRAGADLRERAGLFGRPMVHDHRRILATGIARLRAKIKYRPVVFELMPDEFTLFQLQQTVESLSGRLLHKQNFRRFIEQQQLVEETGDIATETGGRPAKLFRFRREVRIERAIGGTKLPTPRS